MRKETKIGLTVVLVLLVFFGVVVFKKLRGPASLASAAHGGSEADNGGESDEEELALLEPDEPDGNGGHSELPPWERPPSGSGASPSRLAAPGTSGRGATPSYSPGSNDIPTAEEAGLGSGSGLASARPSGSSGSSYTAPRLPDYGASSGEVGTSFGTAALDNVDAGPSAGTSSGAGGSRAPGFPAADAGGFPTAGTAGPTAAAGTAGPTGSTGSGGATSGRSAFGESGAWSSGTSGSASGIGSSSGATASQGDLREPGTLPLAELAGGAPSINAVGEASPSSSASRSGMGQPRNPFATGGTSSFGASGRSPSGASGSSGAGVPASTPHPGPPPGGGMGHTGGTTAAGTTAPTGGDSFGNPHASGSSFGSGGTGTAGTAQIPPAPPSPLAGRESVSGADFSRGADYSRAFDFSDSAPQPPRTASNAGSNAGGFAGGTGSAPRPSFGDPPAPTTVPGVSLPGAAGGAGQYVVQPGDSFWSIARDQYGSARYFRALQQYNEERLGSLAVLRPGRTLSLPAAGTLEERYPELCGIRQAALPGHAASQPYGPFLGPQGERLYRVGPYETLSEIAQAVLGRSSGWSEIYELNRDRLEDPNRLREGAVLRLPPSSVGPAGFPSGGAPSNSTLPPTPALPHEGGGVIPPIPVPAVGGRDDFRWSTPPQ